MGKPKIQPDQPLLLRASIELGGDGKAPTEIRLLRAGDNETDRGYSLRFDDIAAALVMEAYQIDGKKRLYADWNHAMLPALYGKEISREAGASSCSFIPVVRDGELWATEIDWTDKGRSDVEGREYNLFSPAVVPFTDDTGVVRPKRLYNFALVNMAGLRNIEPLLAAMAAASKEETDMNDEQIKALQTRVTELETENRTLRLGSAHVVALSAALGMPGDKAAAEQLPAVQGLVALRSEVFAITGENSPETAVAALRAMKTNAERVIAIEAEIEKTKIAALRAELDGVWKQADADKKLHIKDAPEIESSLTALSGGKLTDKVVDAAKTYVAKLSARVPTPETGAKPPAGDGPAALTDAQKAMLKRHGLDEKIGAQQAARIKDGSAMGAQQ